MLLEEEGAIALTEAIENAVNNPEQAAKRVDEKICDSKKTDTKGILGTIFGFIKDYLDKDEAQSNEAWLKQQFAKPAYSKAWKGNNAEKEQAEAAAGLVQGIEDYENAKKSLRLHMELGGSRASWLAEQIEIGAAVNKKDLKEYAKEVYEGLSAAQDENADFLLDSALTKGGK